MSIKYLKLIPAILLVSSCAWFGAQNDSQIPTISAPPQKLGESNAAMPIVPSSATSAPVSSEVNSQDESENTPRIQEDRSNGTVEQIRVNNRNLPSYYIYPTQQPNYDTTRIPDQNVAPPNWQISW